MDTHPIDAERAVEHLMDLLRIEGLSGLEGDVAAAVRRKLLSAGARAAWVRHDDAHRRIGRGFTVGNLIAQLPGTVKAPRRLLLGHMDTVPLCRGAEPVRRGRRIVAGGATGVRADNRTAVACLVTVAETLLRHRLPHPPLTLLFTVGEENGLYGAKHVRLADLGRPAWGVNIDSGDPGEIITGAIGANRWEAQVRGVSSHAGMHPEQGVSALLAAARAITRVADRGYFGPIRKGRRAGTANAGIIKGGEATNQVTDCVYVRGECRSHDPAFLRVITRAWEQAFAGAARSVRNENGTAAVAAFRLEADYASFHLPDRHPVVRFVLAAARSLGLRARTIRINGGLDANPLNAAGLPTITIGAGQHGAHSVREHVKVDEYVAGCRLALELAMRMD